MYLHVYSSAILFAPFLSLSAGSLEVCRIHSEHNLCSQFTEGCLQGQWTDNNDRYFQQLLLWSISATSSSFSSSFYFLSLCSTHLFLPPYIFSVYVSVTDVTTTKNLELICNSLNPSSTHTLFGVLDYTSTPGGGKCYNYGCQCNTITYTFVPWLSPIH